MPDRIRLDGRVAVVTGAAGVIGTATLHLLAERGARIVAVDRKGADLAAAIKDLPASAEAFAISCWNICRGISWRKPSCSARMESPFARLTACRNAKSEKLAPPFAATDVTTSWLPN